MNLTITTAYYDRKKINDINGFFTLQIVNSKNFNIIKRFEKLPARSGQYGFTDSWTRGNSPIPYSKECVEDLYIWLDWQLQSNEWSGKKGIGEFWFVGTGEDRFKIIGKNGKSRRNIGVHPENSFVGSLGCIVLLNETEKQKQKILKMREHLKKIRENKIKLIVL